MTWTPRYPRESALGREIAEAFKREPNGTDRIDFFDERFSAVKGDYNRPATLVAFLAALDS
jgi:hypothetical protein